MSSSACVNLLLVVIMIYALIGLTTAIKQQRAKRAQKASRDALDKINQLLNTKIQQELLKTDSWGLSEPFNDSPLNQASTEGVLTEEQRHGKPHYDELRVNNPDDYFHGDIELTAWQALRIRRQIEIDGDKDTIYKRWDKRRPINYDFTDSVPDTTRNVIRQALATWQRATCLRFREGGPDVDRLEFYDGGGCSSFVGRTGGTQGISISTPGCDHIGIVAHEVGHALGIFHEQARPDQRSHIFVHYQNIPISRWNNFHPIGDSHAATYNLPYDAGSVMHYGPFGFATDPFRPTISTLDRNLQSTIGQRIEPSFLDIQSVNEAYECYAHCVPSTLACAHGGYPNPSDCSRCVCPRGFGGKYCRQVEYSPCGGVVEVSAYSIYLNSPNYPHPFPKNRTCIWLLRASSANSLIKRQIFVEFVENFQYTCEDSTTCDRSYVELKTGPDFRAAGYRQRFVSAGEEMILMHVGADDPTLGFRVRVWSTGDASTISPSILPTSVMTSMAPNRVFPITKTIMPSTEPPTTNEVITTTASNEISTTAEVSPMTVRFTTIAYRTSFTVSTTEEAFSPLPGEFTKSSTISPTTESSNTALLSTLLPLWPITLAPPPPPLTFPVATLLPILGTTPLPTLIRSSTEEELIAPPESTEIPEHVKCTEACTLWSAWTECSQKCGGCGRRQRKRSCPTAQAHNNCPMEEKRACAFDACPSGTNFLINNAEFHILWKGCCVGMFKRMSGTSQRGSEQCAPLQSGENAFFQIINSLLAQDSKGVKSNGSTRITQKGNAEREIEEGEHGHNSNNNDNMTLARRLANLAGLRKHRDET